MARSHLRKTMARGATLAAIVVAAIALDGMRTVAAQTTPGVTGSAPLAPGGDATGGRVFIDVVDRPFGAVLDYLSRVGEYSIVTMDDDIRNLKVTIRIENVFWRDALDVIAQKYNLEVNENKVRARVLMIERPKLIEMKFQDQDIKYVITTSRQLAGDFSVMIRNLLPPFVKEVAETEEKVESEEE